MRYYIAVVKQTKGKKQWNIWGKNKIQGQRKEEREIEGNGRLS
jgi:hypothetical protein